MPKSLLRELSAASIVSAIGAAAQRWSDADFAPRVRATAAIEKRLGYALPVIDYALDRLFESLQPEVLRRAIQAELGSLEALDGFVPCGPARAAYARGVDRVAVIASDTTIGVAIVPAVFALCAKCTVGVKDRSDLLAGAFFETLADERAEFTAAVSAHAWTGGADTSEDARLSAADVVVAFGSSTALTAIRNALPAEARFIGYGHRASIGFVDLTDASFGTGISRSEFNDLTEGIARDTLLYDGQGCMSLHALFVSGSDADARAFTNELAGAFERVAIEFPAGRSDARSAAAAAAYRNLGTFRAAAGRGAVLAPPGGTGTIAFDPPRDQPPPFLPRILPVYPVHDGSEAIAYLQRHRLPIEAVGCRDPRDAGAVLFAIQAGAVRLTRLGELQAPPADAHHGGSARIADFVRWIDRE